jgi:hypothetical protein
MKARARARIEPLALIAAALAIAMAIYYVWLIRQQGNPPLPWVPALLLAGALLAAYGAVRELPYRHAALLAAAGVLTTLGLLRFFPSGGRSSPPVSWPRPRSCAHLNRRRRHGSIGQRQKRALF